MIRQLFGYCSGEREREGDSQREGEGRTLSLHDNSSNMNMLPSALHLARTPTFRPFYFFFAAWKLNFSDFVVYLMGERGRERSAVA